VACVDYQRLQHLPHLLRNDRSRSLIQNPSIATFFLVHVNVNVQLAEPTFHGDVVENPSLVPNCATDDYLEVPPDHRVGVVLEHMDHDHKDTMMDHRHHIDNLFLGALLSYYGSGTRALFLISALLKTDDTRAQGG
jgi:hypothetical protein